MLIIDYLEKRDMYKETKFYTSSYHPKTILVSMQVQVLTAFIFIYTVRAQNPLKAKLESSIYPAM